MCPSCSLKNTLLFIRLLRGSLLVMSIIYTYYMIWYYINITYYMSYIYLYLLWLLLIVVTINILTNHTIFLRARHHCTRTNDVRHYEPKITRSGWSGNFFELTYFIRARSGVYYVHDNWDESFRSFRVIWANPRKSLGHRNDSGM